MFLRGLQRLPLRLATIQSLARQPSIGRASVFCQTAGFAASSNAEKSSRSNKRQSPETINSEETFHDLPEVEAPTKISKMWFYPHHEKKPDPAPTNVYPRLILEGAEANAWSPELLRRVVDHLMTNGHMFLLPWSDKDAVGHIVSALHELTTQGGLEVQFVVDAFVQKPQFFATFARSSDVVIATIDVICDLAGFDVHDAIRLCASYTTEFLATSPEAIEKRATVFFGAGITAGRQFGRIVRACPAVLFARDAPTMSAVVEGCSSYFTRPQLRQVLERCPSIVLHSFNDIEQLYEYAFYHMGIESDELMTSRRWVDLTLSELMDRHQFLVKAGKYHFPDPKKPQLKLENPPVSQILDSNDDNFAHQVAGLTLEEWKVFRQLSAKLEAQDEKDRPFERIKPSTRKAFERRLKRAKIDADYVM